MPLSIQTETVDQWFHDAIPLLYDHWQELGLDTDLKGDVNTDILRVLEQNKALALITVRDEENLVGYLVAIVNPHLHYRSSPPMFIVDMYYIVPKYRRGAGVRMFKFAEDQARKLGCIKFYLSCKVHKDHTALFEGLGFRLSDFAFTKRL